MDSLRTMQLAVDPPQDGTAVVHVAGELTRAQAARVLRLVGDVARSYPGIARVLVDLADVRAFDLEGVAALHEARRRLDRSGVRLVLAGLDAHRAALPHRIARALRGLDSVPDVERALAGSAR